jgi:hypothetical protein
METWNIGDGRKARCQGVMFGAICRRGLSGGMALP